jgi:hypothetical protein
MIYAVGAHYVAEDGSGAFGGMVRDMGLARTFRLRLDRLPCPLGIHTPVLYSRNQSRTNIALLKEKGKKGTGQLAELLYMILERGRVVCGRYASHTP